MKEYGLSKNCVQIPYPVGRMMDETMKTVREMVGFLEEIYFQKHPIIQLVVQGSSGAIVAGIVAATIREGITVEIRHVKKVGEDSHYGSADLNGYRPIVIIDDFISSGETVNRLHEYVATTLGKDTEIDTLCVSGSFDESYLNFKPNNLICHF